MAQKLEFDEFYNQLENELKQNTELNLEINNEINRIKAQRRKGKIVSFSILVILNAIIIYFFKDIIKEMIVIMITTKNIFTLSVMAISIFIIDVFSYVIGSLIFGVTSSKIKYTRIYKENIIKKIIDNFLDNAEYFPEKCIPEKVYREAKYHERYEDYEGDDYIEAQLDNKYLISLSELYLTHTETETYTDSDGDTHTTTRTVVDFSGLFFKLTNDKSIETEIRIVRNKFWHGKNRQEMDSTEFEKYFDVETEDKIKAMQVLTSDVMDKLVDFCKRMNIFYDVVIKNDEIYIRFFCGKAFEATSIEKGLLNKKPIMEYYNILKFAYEISSELIKNINETEI